MGEIKLFRCPEGKKGCPWGKSLGILKFWVSMGEKQINRTYPQREKIIFFQYILLPCPTTAAAPSASASPPSRGDRQLRGLLLAGLFILFPITAVHRKKKCPQEKFLGVHAEELLLAALFILSSSNNGLRRNKLPQFLGGKNRCPFVKNLNFLGVHRWEKQVSTGKKINFFRWEK